MQFQKRVWEVFTSPSLFKAKVMHFNVEVWITSLSLDKNLCFNEHSLIWHGEACQSETTKWLVRVFERLAHIINVSTKGSIPLACLKKTDGFVDIVPAPAARSCLLVRAGSTGRCLLAISSHYLFKSAALGGEVGTGERYGWVVRADVPILVPTKLSLTSKTSHSSPKIH
jgi:hypothetical protein